MKLLSLLSVMCVITFLQPCEAQLSPSTSAEGTERSDRVAELTKKLNSEDPGERWRAARSLGTLGEPANAAAPKLIQLVSDPEPIVQIYAITSVSRLGIDNEEVVSALAKAVQSSDPRVVRTAILALGRMELEPEQLATSMKQLFSSNNPGMLVYVVDAIADSGERATPLLQAALKEGDDAAYWASIAIAEIGPPAAGAVPELSDALKQAQDIDTRSRILLAIGKVGPEAQPAVPAIVQLLKNDPNPTEALYGAYALGEIGSQGNDAVLSTLVETNQEPVSMVAAWALAKIESNNEKWREQAVKKMLEGLGHENPLVRTTAAKGLLELKPEGEDVRTRLIEAIQDSDPEVAANVIEALASIGPPIVPGIAKSLNDPQLQPLLIRVLGRLGSNAEAAVPQLTALLPKAEPELKTRIHYVLAGIGPAAGPASSAIVQSLNDQEERVRQSALFALRQIGPGAVDALPQLLSFLESSDGMDQLAAAWAIARIAPAKEGVTPEVAAVLRKGLKAEHPATRYETAIAIAEMGDAAGELRNDLKQVAERDPDEQVRVAAARVMSEIGK